MGASNWRPVTRCNIFTPGFLDSLIPVHRQPSKTMRHSITTYDVGAVGLRRIIEDPFAVGLRIRQINAAETRRQNYSVRHQKAATSSGRHAET